MTLKLKAENSDMKKFVQANFFHLKKNGLEYSCGVSLVTTILDNMEL